MSEIDWKEPLQIYKDGDWQLVHLVDEELDHDGDYEVMTISSVSYWYKPDGSNGEGFAYIPPIRNVPIPNAETQAAMAEEPVARFDTVEELMADLNGPEEGDQMEEERSTIDIIRTSLEQIAVALASGNDISISIKIAPGQKRAYVPQMAHVLSRGNDRVRSRILDLCTTTQGLTIGVLYNRMRGTTKGQIESALAKLISDGLVRRENFKHAKTGKPYERLVAI